MRGKERHSVYATQESREILNAKIRARFEKEAHDREKKDIAEVVDIHRRFVNRNSMMELMTKNMYNDRLKEYEPNNNLE